MPTPHVRRPVRALAVLVTAGALSATLIGAPAQAATDPATRLAEKLVKAADVRDANRHLIALQRIADQNGGNRAVPDAEVATSPGYDASVDYVAGKLREAGYRVTTPDAKYTRDVKIAASVKAGSATYAVDKLLLSPDTAAGGVTGPLRVVPEDGDGTGCQTSDFAGQDFTGAIALIRRGGCTFQIKATNAVAAGAIGVIIANNTAGRLNNSTLGVAKPIPVGAVTQADGTALAAQAGTATTLELRYGKVERTIRNVVAETTTGRADNVVMAGAHLDSVPAGPGINDNGSGSAALLDVALKLGGSPKINNKVRFAWWGAEELGLLGSEAYVEKLEFEQQLDIALYLNFDMVGSPNAAYFVYDGNDSDNVGAGPGPYGSAQIERTFTDFFSDRLAVPTEGTDFDGRSDYGPFIAVGIPSGGLFTGAEGVKTAAQVAKWGGTAGLAYDPCYHAACDNLGNVDRKAMDRNLDAMAWSIGIYAYSTEEINGVPAGKQRLLQRAKMLKAKQLTLRTYQQRALDRPAA